MYNTFFNFLSLYHIFWSIELYLGSFSFCSFYFYELPYFWDETSQLFGTKPPAFWDETSVVRNLRYSTNINIGNISYMLVQVIFLHKYCICCVLGLISTVSNYIKPFFSHYVHPPGGWIYYFCFSCRPASDVRRHAWFPLI